MRLWNLAGRPAPDWQGKTRTPRTPPEPRPGVCALTGVVGPVFDARHVVSDLFTSWDRLPFRHRDPAGVAFSPPAAWAFRLRAARQQPHVSDDTALTEADPAMLHAALVALPDHPTWVVTVPISRQKHLLPWAQPGTVRTDDETVTWTADDVNRLGTYTALRRLGFGEAALAEPAPRWPILNRLDVEARMWTLLRWSDLDPWRAHPARLDIAARATRTIKEKAPT